MNTTDKNYVDRLHNQHVNELHEIKNRLLILEGKTPALPWQDQSRNRHRQNL